MTKCKHRRHFLGSMLGAGGLLGLGGMAPFVRLGHAAPAPPTVPGVPTNDRYYIFCFFRGGWDTLLSLDPRDPQVFTPAMAPVTQIVPGYSALESPPPNGQPAYVANTPMGPLGGYMADLLLPKYLNKIAIVRGVNMMTLAHDVGAVRARTGRPPAGIQPRGSSFATWMAHHYSKTEIVPNLTINEEVYNQDLPNAMSPLSANSVQDLINILTPTTAGISDYAQQQVVQLLNTTSQCAAAKNSTLRQNAEQSRASAQALLEKNIAGQFNFMADTPEMATIRSHYGFNDANSSAARAALAVKSITSGFARCVSFVPTNVNLDTHFQNWPRFQAPGQVEAFNNVARMIDDLEATPYPDGSGDNWLDRVTIVCYSEFSRGAMINGYGGRDHWLANSFLLAGADIKGGTVFGATSDLGMSPQPVDLNTGKVDLISGTTIRPAHIYQTLFYAAGFDTELDIPDMRVKPLLPLLNI